MVYTKRHPALLIMGLLLLALGYATSTGIMDGVIKTLAISAKLKSEMIALPYVFGAVATVVGLWQLLGPHREGHLDYYSSAIAGGTFILFVAMIVRWFLDPAVAAFSTEQIGKLSWAGGRYLHDVLGLNYVVLGIIAGMIVVNVFAIPVWAENGVRLSRLGLKTGVILLGTLYSLAELALLGKLSVVMIGIFVLGSVGLVLLYGARRGLPNSMGGVLSAGVGVCGVSAAVAAAPVVQAKSAEIAYTIGTILVWGLGCMFLFPIVGHALGMGPVQFGAWAGTGILNSAQVAGAALAFEPKGIDTLKVAEIFNITRVLFLPLIVLWLAIWYVRRETAAPTLSPQPASAGAAAVSRPPQQVNIGRVIIEKFPLFVLGFIIMFALSSTGIFAPANHYQGSYFDNNVKADKLLKDKDLELLKAEVGKIKVKSQSEAVQRLIASKRIASRDDSFEVKGVVNSGAISKDAAAALRSADRAVWHTAPMIAKFRDWIVWLFAFGLTGLGMQITLASLKQAGGEPLIVGGIVGTLKAVLSLVVVMLFVREMI